MKIYFAGSIRGGRDDKELYAGIIKLLSGYGTVLTEHVGSITLSGMGEAALSDSQIYERDMQWLHSADVIVAEVTTPSLGVGYELGQAEAAGKKMLCLYRPGPERRLSAMLSGNVRMRIKEYSSLSDIEEILRDFLHNNQSL